MDDPPWNDDNLAFQLDNASRYGSDRVNDLLRIGADPNYDIALHYACKLNSPHTAVPLIQWGADLRGRDGVGRTPLHWACDYNRMACVKVCLEHHSPTDIEDNEGRTPVDLAREKNYNEVADYITNYKPLARGPLSGYPSIIQLSEYQVTEWYKLGLYFHLSEDQMGHMRKSEYPSTETFLAAKVNNMELKWKDILEAILSIGEYQLADRVCSDRGEGQTVLSVCTYYCWIDFIKHFADTDGFNPRESVNDAGDSVLSIACTRGHVSVIVYVVKDKGCDLDGPVNAAGDTLRSLAESHGHPEVIKYLDDHSADSADTALSEQEADALRVVLSGKGVKPGEVSLEDGQSTLERVQQQLDEKGYKDLATNLRAKLSEVIQLQKQYLRRLDSLMADQDTIDLCYLKVLLVGPPGVGKTTTLNRLLKEFENIRTAGDKAMRRSTLLANCTQVLAFVGQDEATDWLSSIIGDSDEEAILLIRYLCGYQAEEPTETVDPSEPEEKRGAYVNVGSETVQEKAAVGLPSDMPDSQTGGSPPAEFPVPEISVSTKKLEHLRMVKQRLRKLVRGGDYTKVISHLGNTLLNINDIGGQPGFLEMLPALSTGPAMYLVFLDLSKELDQLFEISFNRDNTVIMPFKSLHTVESTISQILSSIASTHSISQESTSLDVQKVARFGEKFRNFREIQPVAALIGTHLDKLEDPQRKIKETSERLEMVTGKFDQTVVTPPQAVTSSPFFSVNNYDGKAAEDITPIRNFMSKIFSTRFQNASLPIQRKWLILNIILRREYRIVELRDCFEIADMLDIDREEIKFCLWYLDCIGTLMYYTNIADEDNWFKNHVICSPQVIFDSISQFIVSSMSTLHAGGTVTKREREELIKKGQFSVESIEMLCQNKEVSDQLEKKELIPVKQLIQLLKHVNLLSPIIHKEADGERITYLMPAVLECATLDELTTPPPPDADNPEPLLVTFKCGYVPTGTFCGLISQLVSRGPDGILDFVWNLVEDGVKRNLVSLYVDYVNKVTLICHDACYEIRVTRGDPKISLHKLCAHVLSVIQLILNDKKLEPKIAFRCPCSKHKDKKATSNLCTSVDTKGDRFLCEKSFVELEDAQKVWIGQREDQSKGNPKEPSGRSPQPAQPLSQGDLTHKEVVKAAFNARSKWFDLGIELDIDVDTLEIIEEEEKKVDVCYPAMLKHWVEQATPTWYTLVEALESKVMGRSDIAAKIQSQYNIVKEPSGKGGFTLREVRRATWAARTDWSLLGSELGIELDTLQTIEEDLKNVGRRHTHMLIHWLRQPPTNITPSWTTMVKALRSKTVARGDIADHIEKHYMQ